MVLINFEETYPETWSRLPSDIKEEIIGSELRIDRLPEYLKDNADRLGEKAYLPELARLEQEISRVKSFCFEVPQHISAHEVNPSLVLLELSWQNLTNLVEDGDRLKEPSIGEEIVILYKRVGDGELIVKKAGNEELLALKLVVEGYDLREVSRQTGKPLWLLREFIERAVEQEIVLKPESGIKRPSEFYNASREFGEEYFVSETFTLQWHITQHCDLHCKHCYDRSDRKTLRFNDALRILDDFYDFCDRMNVHGKISLSGGNPFLHPRFLDIYREAIERGFTVAVVGNPVSASRLEELMGIKPPYFYQVSLEGLREYNDYIRGKGHYDRTIEFLKLLRDFNIYSMVMLTLNRDNIGQVIPLARKLHGLTDTFTFNRLSMVGEGASLMLPDKETFRGFLKQYLAETRRNDTLSLKDNLFNILLNEKGEELTGGCTGFGCGAAFNFVSLLPDGEVHACRKFPSCIGNILDEPLIDIYHSERAEQYRRGPSECKGCRIRPVCGGCLAITYSMGFDFTKTKDPFCFINHG